MTNLTDRMREWQATSDPVAGEKLMREAADEIERLNGLVARQDGLIERLRAEIEGLKPLVCAPCKRGQVGMIDATSKS